MTRLLLAFTLLGTGCAAGPRSTVPDPAPVAAQADRDLLLLESLEAQLDAALAEPPMAPRPTPAEDPCPFVCARQEAICDLTSRICTLSDRNERAPELELRCGDARRRCQSARARVTEQCACPEP